MAMGSDLFSGRRVAVWENERDVETVTELHPFPIRMQEPPLSPTITPIAYLPPDAGTSARATIASFLVPWSGTP